MGSWRGVGQVQRGRVRGAWTESADWAWKLTSDSAGLEITVKKGKYLKAGVLRPGKAPGTFVFEATLADGTSRTFAGKAGGTEAAGPDGRRQGPGRRSAPGLDHPAARHPPARPAGGRGPRDATPSPGSARSATRREGVAFAAVESYPLCVVTEGRGTIQVRYKGKTYWVCCSGCRDLFKDDPESVLAEAAAREKARAKK